ncbi:MAG: TIGR04283 family arsenosugar biosynthesis glycosyltransferase [Bradyrhizobium sp.]
MLSIIIPTLNEQQTIETSLSALQPLRRRGVEVIVVDGGSEDNSIRLACPLCDNAIIAKRGRASQMNAGARQSTGDILLFLHSDTVLPEGALEAINHAFMAPGCVWGRFDVKIDSPLRLLNGVAFMMNLRSRWTGIATGDQAIFVTRDAFERIGGFPAVSLMEDIALSKSLKRLSPPACIRAKVTTSGRRWERNGIVRTILLMWRLRLAYFLGAAPSRLAEQYAHARRDA